MQINKEVKNIFFALFGYLETSVDIVVGKENVTKVIKKTKIGLTKEYIETASTPNDLDMMILDDIEMIFVTIERNIMEIIEKREDFLIILVSFILKI